MVTTQRYAQSEAHLAELRQSLERRRRQLTEEMHARLREVRTQGATSRRLLVDEDLGDLDARDDLAATIIEMKSRMLHGIDHALRLMNEGKYGMCAECGSQIGGNRLRAVPFALRCTPCEEAHETRVHAFRRAGIERDSRE